MNLQDLAELRYAQMAEVSKYNSDAPETRRQQFAQSMRAVTTVLHEYTPSAKYVAVPVAFTKIDYLKDLDFPKKYTLTVKFDGQKKTVNLIPLKRFCLQQVKDDVILCQVCEISDNFSISPGYILFLTIEYVYNDSGATSGGGLAASTPSSSSPLSSPTTLSTPSTPSTASGGDSPLSLYTLKPNDLKTVTFYTPAAVSASAPPGTSIKSPLIEYTPGKPGLSYTDNYKITYATDGILLTNESFKPISAKEFQLDDYPEPPFFLPNGWCETPLPYAFGLKLEKNLVPLYSDQTEVDVDLKIGLEEFMREAISDAEVNPGGAIRAHLYTDLKRRKIDDDGMTAGQAYLEHEIRDREHSSKWWINNIIKVCAATIILLDVTRKNISELKSITSTKLNLDAKFLNAIEIKTDYDAGFNTIRFEATFAKTFEDIKKILNTCNGYFASSVAADGNILTAGVTGACLLENDISVLTDNEIAQRIPFAGMHDPTDRYALVIPNAINVSARNATDVAVGMGGSNSSTVMQLGGTKKLTKYARQLLGQLRNKASASTGSSQQALNDNECYNVICSALIEMANADSEGNGRSSKLFVTLNNIVRTEEFKRARNNRTFLKLLEGNDRVVKTFSRDEFCLVELNMVLALQDQAELRSFRQIENIRQVDIFNTSTRWVYGSCINDAFEIKHLTLYFPKNFDDAQEELRDNPDLEGIHSLLPAKP